MSAPDIAAEALPPADRFARAKAILLVVLAVSQFGIMDGIGKFLGPSYPVGEIVWARFAFALPLVLLVAGRSVGWKLFATRRPIIQLIRGILPIAASAVVIFGLAYIPLADFTAISFASPLIVVLLAVPLLHEAISRATWIGIALGFAGVMLIARPGEGVIGWGALFPLAGATLFGIYQVLTRLVSRDDSAVVSFACVFAVGVLLATPALLFGWRTPGPADAVLLVLSGLLMGGGHYFLIQAYSIAAANVLAPFTYAQIIAASLFGLLVFGDVPDAWSIAGTALIVAAGLYVLRRKVG